MQPSRQLFPSGLLWLAVQIAIGCGGAPPARHKAMHRRPTPAPVYAGPDAPVVAAEPKLLNVGAVAGAAGGTVVVLYRDMRTETTYLAKHDGKQLLWSVPVDGNVTSLDLAVSDDLVVLRYQDLQDLAVERAAALELADGRQRWSVGVRDIGARFEVVPGQMSVTPSAIAVPTGSQEGVLLDRTNGKKLKNFTGKGWSNVQVDLGRGRKCLSEKEERRSLRSLSKSKDKRLRARLRSMGWMGGIKLHGKFRGNNVFLLFFGANEHALVVVTPRGKVLVDIEFPLSAFDYECRNPDPLPLELPRFVPLRYMSDEDAEAGPAWRVAVADLELGNVTRILGAREQLAHVLRHGGHWVIAREHDVVTVDTEKGTSVHATMKYPTNTVFEKQLSEGLLWLMEKEDSDRVIVERVDLATLTPQFGTDLIERAP